MRTSRILALGAAVIIIIGLFLPIYTMTLRFPLQGLGEFNYEIGYSLLGTTTKTTINLEKGLSIDPEKLEMTGSEETTVKELLSESGFPDVKQMAEESGFPVDVSMLPIDIDSLAEISDPNSATSEIPLKSSEADLQSYIPTLPGPLSSLPIADITSLGLRFGPLIFIIPPFIGIARGKYGKATSTFILLLILPLIIPIFTPILAVSMNIGWYVMFAGSILLVATSIIQRRETQEIH